MYDRGAWFLRVIMSSSRALCCPAGRQSVKTQKHDFQVCFVNRGRHRKNGWRQGLTRHKNMPSDREQNRYSEFRGLGNTSSLRKLFFESLSAVFVSSHPSFHRTVFFGAKVAFSTWRRYGLMSSLRHFYVFVSSYLVTLSPCYPVTLLPFYPVTLLSCYPVTLLPCYLACVASVSSRGSSRKLGQEQKKKKKWRGRGKGTKGFFLLPL